jgi:hypothetical protein
METRPAMTLDALIVSVLTRRPDGGAPVCIVCGAYAQRREQPASGRVLVHCGRCGSTLEDARSSHEHQVESVLISQR